MLHSERGGIQECVLEKHRVRVPANHYGLDNRKPASMGKPLMFALAPLNGKKKKVWWWIWQELEISFIRTLKSPDCCNLLVNELYHLMISDGILWWRPLSLLASTSRQFTSPPTTETSVVEMLELGNLSKSQCPAESSEVRMARWLASQTKRPDSNRC